MTRIITLENQPPMAAVFNMAAGGFAQAAEQAHDLLWSSRFSAVVVLRDSGTLEQTWRTTADSIGAIPEDSIKKSFSWQVGNMPAGEETGLLQSITKSCGADYADMSRFLRAFCNNKYQWMEVRAHDEGNVKAHVDFSSSVDIPLPESWSDEQAREDGVPLYGVTMTMGMGLGGTQLLEVSAEDIRNHLQDNNAYTGGWEEAWTAGPGAITILKSRGWMDREGHLAAVHRSPPRLRDGDPEERSACVAFVKGRYRQAGM